MNVKGVITKILKKLKSHNSKNISRNFSEAVVGSVGSVQCQIVPYSGLYLFSRSIGAPQRYSLSVNCWVLLCFTCHFQNGFPSFILFSSVNKFLQSLISALT